MRTGVKVGLGVLVVGAAACLIAPIGRFVMGGAMVDIGYRLQDHLANFDFEHEGHALRPSAVWDELLRQNRLASQVRSTFPRSRYHPVIALVACMDARIDTNELTGDTRRYYYVIRTAGSVMSEREEEMLELAVQNGVRLIVLTTHSDCAAERAAASPSLSAQFPRLTEGVRERERRIAEFLARPLIAEHIARGELQVRRAQIDTASEQLVPAP